MVRPFKDGMLQQAGPMSDVLTELTGHLDELKRYKALEEDGMTLADA